MNELSPLVNQQGQNFLNRMLQSPAAPLYNHQAGDRIFKEDLEHLNQFRSQLNQTKPMQKPSQELLTRVEKWLRTVPLYRERIKEIKNLSRDWHQLPTISRKELAEHPEFLVPDDQELNRLIVYRTAGTTGHPLLVPHHPRAAASYQILIENALKQIGVFPKFEIGRVACFLIGAQKKTVTYPTLLSAWNQAGFAKLNINPEDWRKPEDRRQYFSEFQPEILTGDPISFATLAELDIDIHPKALISTAVAMSPSLKKSLQIRFGAPVIDWYSLTETGPIGFMNPNDENYSLLPHDLYVEVLDEHGHTCSENQVGEIVVSGGRNPFIPLIRYRTGDFGCRIGNQLTQLEGRKPVHFRARSNAKINSVDIARVLREYPIVQHFFEQRLDLSCVVRIRPFSNSEVFATQRLVDELSALFGGVPIEINFDAELGDHFSGQKLTPYASAFNCEQNYEE